MAHRIAQRSAATVERRPPVATTTQRSAGAGAPSPTRALQQRLGNQGAQALAARVVARSSAPSIMPASGMGMGQLSLSQPGDAHEREADRVADVVMRMTVPGSMPTSPSMPMVQRGCTECKDAISTRDPADQPVIAGNATHVHRSAGAYGPSQVSAPVAASIHDMQGGGAPLPATTRAFFEPRFGAEFSHVRVHTGGRADSTAKAISAKAFTVGSDIVFAGGQYSPESHEGQRLLAHELTHVMQQSPRELRRDVQRPDGHTAAQVVHSTEQVQGKSDGMIVQRDLLDDIGDAISDKARSVVGTVTNVASDVADTASGAFDSVKERLQQALDAGLGQITNTWTLVKNGATTAVDGAFQQANGFLSGIGVLFGGIGTALRSLDVDALRTVWSAITGTANEALTDVRGLVAQVTVMVDGLWSGLKGLADRVIGGLQALANGLIGRLPSAVQGLASSLWSKIEAKLTSAWRAIEAAWISVRESTFKRVNQLVAAVAAVVTRIKGSVITVIINTLDRLRRLFTFLKEVMANPNILIDPVVKDITGRLQPLPDKSKAYVQTKVRENAAGGPTTTPAASSINRVIQRAAALADHPRSTLGVGDVISGCWDLLTDKLGALWAKLGSTIKEMVLSLVYPPATWNALKKDWTQMTDELSTRVSRIDSVRTDTWDGFSEDIRRYLSNLADFPLIVLRAVNAMLGHLSVYIGLAIVLGGAVAGAIAVATGGAIFGSVVPAAGTAAGAGLGLGAGFLAGASAGYTLAETVGLILLGLFLIVEQVSIAKAIIDLLGIPQTEEEQKEDFNQATDSTIAIVTALLLMGIAFIGVALAKRVWAFVKSIPGRFRPKPKVVDPAPAGPKSIEPPVAKSNKVIICRICVELKTVPPEILARRAKLSREMQAFLDEKLNGFVNDPLNPTPAEFQRLTRMLDAIEKANKGDLEAGLRAAKARENPTVKPPFGLDAEVAKLPRLREAAKQLLAEIEDFAAKNPDRSTIRRSGKRVADDMKGILTDMETGKAEVTPERIEGFENNLKGVQEEFDRAKASPRGTQFGVKKSGREIDMISPDGSRWVNNKNLKPFGENDPRVADLTTQAEETIKVAQLAEHAVGGKAPEVEFNFGKGVTPEVASKLRKVTVGGQSLIVTGPEIPLKP